MDGYNKMERDQSRVLVGTESRVAKRGGRVSLVPTLGLLCAGLELVNINIICLGLWSAEELLSGRGSFYQVASAELSVKPPLTDS